MEQDSTKKHIVTVLGNLVLGIGGTIDAHNHVWISKLKGVQPGSPFLDQFDLISRELQEFYIAGGRGIIDCQPVGCGRDGNNLMALSKQSSVHIICCTGFHRRDYYPPDASIWKMDSESLATLFCSELQVNLQENINHEKMIRAGFIKVAFEESVKKTPQVQLEAASIAARETESAIEAHTEKGKDAENILRYFLDAGIPASKIIICHIDKRPDFVLHRELAKEGVLLEYDTFFRQKYDPERNLWPLLTKMLLDGFDDSIALATDMAEADSWRSLGTGPGLIGLCNQVKNRLICEQFSEITIHKIMNLNVLACLSKTG